MSNRNRYISIDNLATHLNLPRSYIEQLVRERKIPYLTLPTKGSVKRLRFNPEAVLSALDRLAEQEYEGAGNE